MWFEFLSASRRLLMKTITVKGMGKASVKPDLIVISMRLETEDKKYDKTTELAAEKIEILNKSLEEVGFEKQSVKTTNFFVRANYENVRDKNGVYKNEFKGYVCSHNLKIEFDFDTKRLATALSAISACVATPEFSISFTVKDRSKISDELLKSAAKNAREKAEILCAASGVKLGGLISIDYKWGETDVYSDTAYRIENRRMMKAEACFANVDIEPEEINLNDTVTFVWEIV